MTISANGGVRSTSRRSRPNELPSSPSLPVAEGKVSSISLELKVNAGKMLQSHLGTTLKVGAIEFFDRRILENENSSINDSISIPVAPANSNIGVRADAWNDRPRETLLIGRVGGSTNDSSLAFMSATPHISATFSVPFCAFTALTGGHNIIESTNNGNLIKESAINAHIFVAPTRVTALPAPTLALIHAIDVLTCAAAAAATKSMEAAVPEQRAHDYPSGNSSSRDRSLSRNKSGNFVERDRNLNNGQTPATTAGAALEKRHLGSTPASLGASLSGLNHSFASPRERDRRRHNTRPSSLSNTLRRSTSEPLPSPASPPKRSASSSEAMQPLSTSPSRSIGHSLYDQSEGPGVGCNITWLQALVLVPVKVKVDIAPCEVWALDGSHAIVAIVHGALEVSLLPQELTPRTDAVYWPRSDRKRTQSSDVADHGSTSSSSSTCNSSGVDSPNPDGCGVLSARAAPFVTLDIKAGASLRAGPLDAQPLKADRCTELVSLPNLTVAYTCRALTFKHYSSSSSTVDASTSTSTAAPNDPRNATENVPSIPRTATSPLVVLRLLKLAHSIDVSIAPLSVSLHLTTLALVTNLVQRLSMEWASVASMSNSPPNQAYTSSSSFKSAHRRKHAAEWASAKADTKAKAIGKKEAGDARRKDKRPLSSEGSLSHSKTDQTVRPPRCATNRMSSSESPRARAPLHNINNSSSSSSVNDACSEAKEGSQRMPELDSWAAALLLLSEMDVSLRSDGVHIMVLEPSAVNSNSNSSSSSSSSSGGNEGTTCNRKEKAVLQVSLTSLEGTVMLRHAGHRSAPLIGPIAADGSARIAAATATLLASPAALSKVAPGATAAADDDDDDDAAAKAPVEMVVAAGTALGTLSIGLQPQVAAWYWHRGLECWEPLVEQWSVSLVSQLQLSSLVQLPSSVPSAVALPAHLLPRKEEIGPSGSLPGWAGDQAGGATSDSTTGVNQSPSTSSATATTPLTPRLQAARLAAAMAWDSPRALSQSLSDAFLATLEKVGVARRSSSSNNSGSGSGNSNSAPPSPGLSSAFDLNAGAEAQASGAAESDTHGSAAVVAREGAAPVNNSAAAVAEGPAPSGAVFSLGASLNSSVTSTDAPLDSLRGGLLDPLDNIQEAEDEGKEIDEFGDEVDYGDVDSEDTVDGNVTAAVAVAVASRKRLEINVSEALLETTAQLLASCANIASSDGTSAIALENVTGSKLWFSTSSHSSFSPGHDGGTCFAYLQCFNLRLCFPKGSNTF